MNTQLCIPGNYPDYDYTPLETKISLLDWQKQKLMYTATGYGSKIPTQYMVKHGNRWKRVYCAIYSNVGSLYIIANNQKIIVDTIQELSR